MRQEPRAKILVTGGMGFVGQHLVTRLLALGHEVHVGDVQCHATVPEGAHYVPLDVTNFDAVSHAMRGIQSVFHVASLVQTHRAKAAAVWAVNRDGTQNVIRACELEGVSRLVYVSSASVVYAGEDIENGDESLGYSEKFQAPYAESKMVAEQAVLRAHNPGGLRTCAIRPHIVFGPGDQRFLPAIIKRAEAGKLRFGVGRAKRISDFTYIDNLIDALVVANEKLGRQPEVGGQAFFVTNGEPIAFWEFVDRVLLAMERPVTKGRIPFAVAYVAACAAEAWRAAGRSENISEDGLTRFAIRYMCTHHYFSISKARRLLGYVPAVSLDEGIARSVAHFKSLSAA